MGLLAVHSGRHLIEARGHGSGRGGRSARGRRTHNGETRSLDSGDPVTHPAVWGVRRLGVFVVDGYSTQLHEGHITTALPRHFSRGDFANQLPGLSYVPLGEVRAPTIFARACTKGMGSSPLPQPTYSFYPNPLMSSPLSLALTVWQRRGAAASTVSAVATRVGESGDAGPGAAVSAPAGEPLSSENAGTPLVLADAASAAASEDGAGERPSAKAFPPRGGSATCRAGGRPARGTASPGRRRRRGRGHPARRLGRRGGGQGPPRARRRLAAGGGRGDAGQCDGRDGPDSVARRRRRGHVDVVAALLAEGASAGVADMVRRTPLHAAAATHGR